MSLTTIVFEPHATSLDNEAGRASGWHDVGLAPAGEREAAELGHRYAASPPHVVYVSDAWRAFRTAEIAFGERVPIVRDIRLRECDYGRLTQAPVAEIDAVRHLHVTTRFPDGESYEDVVARVRAWLDEVLEENAGATILVIAHRATGYALEHLLGRRPLAEVVAAPWQWQPGWRYAVDAATADPESRPLPSRPW
jgi:broad specificity phosphatase PhoE